MKLCLFFLMQKVCLLFKLFYFSSFSFFRSLSCFGFFQSLLNCWLVLISFSRKRIFTFGWNLSLWLVWVIIDCNRNSERKLCSQTFKLFCFFFLPQLNLYLLFSQLSLLFFNFVHSGNLFLFNFFLFFFSVLNSFLLFNLQFFQILFHFLQLQLIFLSNFLSFLFSLYPCLFLSFFSFDFKLLKIFSYLLKSSLFCKFLLLGFFFSLLFNLGLFQLNLFFQIEVAGITDYWFHWWQVSSCCFDFVVLWFWNLGLLWKGLRFYRFIFCFWLDRCLNQFWLHWFHIWSCNCCCFDLVTGWFFGFSWDLFLLFLRRFLLFFDLRRLFWFILGNLIFIKFCYFDFVLVFFLIFYWFLFFLNLFVCLVCCLFWCFSLL